MGAKQVGRCTTGRWNTHKGDFAYTEEPAIHPVFCSLRRSSNNGDCLKHHLLKKSLFEIWESSEEARLLTKISETESRNCLCTDFFWIVFLLNCIPLFLFLPSGMTFSIRLLYYLYPPSIPDLFEYDEKNQVSLIHTFVYLFQQSFIGILPCATSYTRSWQWIFT